MSDPVSADPVIGFNRAEGDRVRLAAGQTNTVGTAADGGALPGLSTGGTIELSGVQAASVNQSFFAA